MALSCHLLPQEPVCIAPQSPVGRFALEGGGGHRVVQQPLVKPVGYVWESGWGAGRGGYKAVAAAVGVRRMRLSATDSNCWGQGRVGGLPPSGHACPCGMRFALQILGRRCRGPPLPRRPSSALWRSARCCALSSSPSIWCWASFLWRWRTNRRERRQTWSTRSLRRRTSLRSRRSISMIMGYGSDDGHGVRPAMAVVRAAAVHRACVSGVGGLSGGR